jgi:hypothetical protein
MTCDAGANAETLAERLLATRPLYVRRTQLPIRATQHRHVHVNAQHDATTLQRKLDQTCEALDSLHLLDYETTSVTDDPLTWPLHISQFRTKTT